MINNLLAVEMFSLESLKNIVFLGAVVVLPFFLGSLLAKRLRMRDYSRKFGLIFFTMALAATIIARTWDPVDKRFEIPLGVDLQGGVILIYEVDKEVAGKLVDDTKSQGTKSIAGQNLGEGQFSMSALVEAIGRRINPGGTKEIVVRPFGQGQIEIIIPEIEDQAVEQIKKVISTSGVLEFRIVANSRNHDHVINLARIMADDLTQRRSRYVTDESGERVGLWARVAREQDVIQGIRPFKVDVGNSVLRNSSTGQLLTVPPEVSNNSTDRGDGAARLRLARWVADQDIKEIDVLMFAGDGLNVNGSHLGSVMKGNDEFMKPDIAFTLKGQGVALFSELTGQNAPSESFHSRLGIVLDNELLSAPNIQERITGSGRITGQ
jgi:SecD/SecF fusion protein